MITKLTALILSGIMTVGLVAASAPPVTPTEKIVDLGPMINACRQGYTNYRHGTMTGPEALQEVLDKFEGEDKDMTLLICYGYGEGYDDGVRGEV